MPVVWKNRGNLVVAVVLILMLGFTWGCKSEEEEAGGVATTETAPALPPVQSMMVDFSTMGFGSSPNSIDLSSNRSISHSILGTHFADAAIVVLYWNVAVITNLAIPAMVFGVAGSQPAVDEGNRTWTWTIPSTTIGAKQVSAQLTGVVSEDGTAVGWSMKINATPTDANDCCTNFEWFTGEHTVHAGNGTWQFYDPAAPAAAEKNWAIAWNVASSTEKTLTFTNNSSDATTDSWGNGSDLKYAVSGDTVTFTAQNSIKNNATIINWNTADTSGNIRYDDGSTKGCWNTEKKDAACP